MQDIDCLFEQFDAGLHVLDIPDAHVEILRLSAFLLPLVQGAEGDFVLCHEFANRSCACIKEPQELFSLLRCVFHFTSFSRFAGWEV